MKPILSPPPLPERPADAHKGSFGHVLVTAGSSGMTGAAALCALASLRSGAGLASVAAPAPLMPLILPSTPEVTWLGLETDPARLMPEDVNAVLEHLSEKSTVLAIGPGLGRHEGTAAAVRRILTESPRPAVVDADALFAFKGEPEALRNVPGPCILTPHPGEMSTLLGISTPEVQEDRRKTAAEAAGKTGKIVVLKGHETIVTNGDDFYVGRTGGPALAKGGTGDVLTGMTAAFLAQGLEPLGAAVLAVHLHGLAGDMAAAELGDSSVLARDILDRIPEAFVSYNEGVYGR